MVRVSALIAVFLLASGAPAFAQSKSALTAAEIEAVLSTPVLR